jgi:hypothetical protein
MLTDSVSNMSNIAPKGSQQLFEQYMLRVGVNPRVFWRMLKNPNVHLR